jgi:hypothetical protein
MKKKCTCGTQIVGGLCSSWCDLVRPDETPPYTERSAEEPFTFDPYVYNPAGFWLLPKGVQYIPPQPPPLPAAKKPQPTLSAAGVADGTSADDRVCKCGNYIIKHKSVHVDAQAKAHFELGCF